MTKTLSMKMSQRHNLFALAALMAGALAVFGADESEEFHQTHPLSKTGQVSLENVNGSVRVTVWDREEIKVDAVKRAKKREHLQAVDIDVKAAADKVQIRTKYPEGKNNNNSTTVNYTLTVPRDSKLHKISTVNGGVEIEGVGGEINVSSVNGQILVNGLAGDAHLSTVNGSVKATVKDLRHPLSLSSVNGGLTVALPSGVNADLSASVLNGGISTDLDLKVEKSFPVGQKLEGKLGHGGPKVKLSTVNGSVHIDRAKTISAEAEK